MDKRQAMIERDCLTVALDLSHTPFSKAVETIQQQWKQMESGLLAASGRAAEVESAFQKAKAEHKLEMENSQQRINHLLARMHSFQAELKQERDRYDALARTARKMHSEFAQSQALLKAEKNTTAELAEKLKQVEAQYKAECDRTRQLLKLQENAVSERKQMETELSRVTQESQGRERDLRFALAGELKRTGDLTRALKEQAEAFSQQTKQQQEASLNARRKLEAQLKQMSGQSFQRDQAQASMRASLESAERREQELERQVRELTVSQRDICKEKAEEHARFLGIIRQLKKDIHALECENRFLQDRHQHAVHKVSADQSLSSVFLDQGTVLSVLPESES